MTKKLKFYLFSSALLLLVTSIVSSCEKENFVKEENLKFSISDAKKYHLEKATDLRFMNPNMNAVVKSNIDYNEILVPEWDKAKVFETEVETHTFITHEIPIKTGRIIGGILIKKDSLSTQNTIEYASMSCNLVIQEITCKEDNSKHIRQFIATIIGNDIALPRNSTAFNHMGDKKNFTGYMIISNLSGKIHSLSQYKNGKHKRVYIQLKDSTALSSYEGFSFLQAPLVKGGDAVHGGNQEPGNCGQCGNHDQIYINWGLCPECFAKSEFIDGVIVTPEYKYCSGCDMLIENCMCYEEHVCSLCNNIPCTCGYRCENCGSPTCYDRQECGGEETEEGGGEEPEPPAQDDTICTYSINITIDGGGTVSGGGTFNKNGRTIISATPNNGYVFGGWSGDLSGRQNPMEITVDKDYSITGHFYLESSICGKLAKTIDNYDVLNNLRSMIEISGIEKGYIRTSTNAEYFNGKVNSVKIPYRANVLEVVHTHKLEIHPSLSDLRSIYRRYMRGDITNVEDFKYTIVSPDYFVVFQINDESKIAALIRDSIIVKRDGGYTMSEFYREKYKNAIPNDTNKSIEIYFGNFVNFMNSIESGLSISLHKNDINSDAISSKFISDTTDIDDLINNFEICKK